LKLSVMLLVFILTSSLPVAGKPIHQQRRSTTSVPVSPEFVKVLHLRLGVDTEHRLENKIGKGEVTIGGHSNSGRVWLFRNGLKLLADGFEGDGGSYILDTLVFSEWRGRLGETKELAKFGLGSWSKLQIGMSKQGCLQVLPKSMPKPTMAKDEFTWKKDVIGKRNGKRGKFHYEAALRFTHGRLASLLLEGYLLNR